MWWGALECYNTIMGAKGQHRPQDLSSGHEVCEQARSAAAEQSHQTGLKMLIWDSFG